MGIGAAAVGGAAMLGSSYMSSRAASKGAKAQAKASKRASEIELQMFREGQAAQAPWREAGERALGILEERVMAGPGEYTQDPGYQFRLGEGLKQIQSGRGNIRSGATEKALQRYAQDYATGDYQNFLNRYNQSLTPLQSLSGVGQTTSAQGAQLGGQVAGQIGQNIQQSGAAKASGYAQQANIMSGMVGQGLGLAAASYGGPGWGGGGGAGAAGPRPIMKPWGGR